MASLKPSYRPKRAKKDSGTVIRFDDTGNINWYKTPGLNIETMPSDRLHLNAEASEKLIEPVV